jgi:hypothetical protein
MAMEDWTTYRALRWVAAETALREQIFCTVATKVAARLTVAMGYAFANVTMSFTSRIGLG